MSDYRAWDREEKLGLPPWSPDDPKLIAWEEAHGHDVRLKCYPEFGCRFAWDEIEVTDEMVKRARTVLQRANSHPFTVRWSEIDAHIRPALEAALDPSPRPQKSA